MTSGAPGPRRRRASRHAASPPRSRVVVGVLGEILMTLGALVLLFAVWQLWWTDVVAGRAQAAEVSRVEQHFQDDPAIVTPTSGPSRGTSVRASEPEPTIAGDVFALIRIPRFGAGDVHPVVDGTSLADLRQGVGHYASTALPGQVGNMALAGHRTTWAKPFSRIDELRPGDAVVIETATAYVVYRVRSSEIVAPTDWAVVAPVPDQPGEKPTQAWLTLTSCHPRYSARQRYVVHALLDHVYPRAQGLPAGLLTTVPS